MVFDKYIQLKKLAQTRVDASTGFDIFDLNSTELVFWEKDTTLKMADEGDLRLAYPGGGVIDLTKKTQSSDQDLIKLYTSFVNSLYNLTGTGGYIWKAHIEMIVLYFLTTTPLAS